jgi:hypothetical protein
LITAGIATPAAPSRPAINTSSPDTTSIQQGFGLVASEIMGMARHLPAVPRAEEARPQLHDRSLDWDRGRFNFPPRGTIPRLYWVPDLRILTWKENYAAAQHAQLEGKKHVESVDGLFRPMRGFHARVDIRLGIDRWFELPLDELDQDSEEDGSDEKLHEFHYHLPSLPMAAILEEMNNDRSESPASNIYDASPRVSLESTGLRSPPAVSSQLAFFPPPTPPNTVDDTFFLSPRSPETQAEIGSLDLSHTLNNHLFHTTPYQLTPIGCISTFPGDPALRSSSSTPPNGFLAHHPLQRTTPGEAITMPRPGFLDLPYQPLILRPAPIGITFSPDSSTIHPITGENLEANNSLIYHHSGVPRQGGRPNPVIVDTRDNRPIVRDLELPVLAYGEVVWVVVEHAERGGWFLFNTSPRMEA